MSTSPCAPNTITPAILDTVLGHLAPHFLTSAKGDRPTARHAASHMLAACGLETEEELRLAAAIVGFSFHALEALSEAAQADLAIEAKLSFRAMAVSLSREAHKSQRKLDQLQRARPIAPPSDIVAPALRPVRHAAALRTVMHAPATDAPPSLPGVTPDQPASPPAGLIEVAREAIRAGTTTGGAKAWSQWRQQHGAAERSARNLDRGRAAQDRPAASATPAQAENESRRTVV